MLTLIGSPQLLIFGFIHVCWPGRPISVISSSGQEVTAEDHIIRQLWKGTTVCREGTMCALCSQALSQGQESLKAGTQPQTEPVSACHQLAAVARPTTHASP